MVLDQDNSEKNTNASTLWCVLKMLELNKKANNQPTNQTQNLQFLTHKDSKTIAPWNSTNVSKPVQSSNEKVRFHEVITWKKHHRVNFMHVDEMCT